MLLLAIIFYHKGYAFGSTLAATGHASKHGLNIEKVDQHPAELWIEVHDVSPGYGLEMLAEVSKIIDKHKTDVDKIMLFVIPHHKGSTALRKYPEYTAELKKLDGNGYQICMHGYTHDVGWIDTEFKTNWSNAQSLLEKSKREFVLAELEVPNCFSPPSWRASNDASKLLRSEFTYVFYAFFIDTKNSTLPYPMHEYTWSGVDMGGLKSAKKSYKNARGIYRLTMHLNAVNSDENLRFLDEFLEFVAVEKQDA